MYCWMASIKMPSTIPSISSLNGCGQVEGIGKVSLFAATP